MGYIQYDENQQCRLRMVDDTCESHMDCTAAMNYTECNNETCGCELGYQAYDSLEGCYRRRIGDKTCQIKEDCLFAVDNSLCQNNTCFCVSGFLAMNNNSDCIKRKF